MQRPNLRDFVDKILPGARCSLGFDLTTEKYSITIVLEDKYISGIVHPTDSENDMLDRVSKMVDELKKGIK